MVALILGLTIGWVFGALQTESPRPTSTSVGTTSPTDTEIALSSVLTATTAAGDEIPGPSVASSRSVTSPVDRPEVEPMTGAAQLEGEVALTRALSSRGNALYVFRPGGSLVLRGDTEFQRGGFAYPMLLTAGRLVFTDLYGAFVLDSDLMSGPELLGEASYVVPGARPGLVWLVGDTWVAPLEVETGTVGDRYDNGEFSEALAGVASGLIVAPDDQNSFGQIAYWTAAEGLVSIDLAYDPLTSVVAAAENMAVVATPDFVQTLNLGDGSAPTTFPLDLSSERISEVCLSSDLRYVAIVGSDGDAVVVETDTGGVVLTPRDVFPQNGIGWASPAQFVYVVDLPGGRLLQAVDVPTGVTQAVASLEPVGGWWLAASGAMC